MNTILTLTLLRTIIVILGSFFLWKAGKSYLKHRSQNLLLLFLAVGAITVGAVVEGIMIQIIGTSIDIAHVTESVFLLIGFAILVWSITHPDRASRQE